RNDIPPKIRECRVAMKEYDRGAGSGIDLAHYGIEDLDTPSWMRVGGADCSNRDHFVDSHRVTPDQGKELCRANSTSICGRGICSGVGQERPCLSQYDVGVRTHAEIGGLLEPEHLAVLVDQDRGRDRQVAERTAPGCKVTLRNIVEAVDREIGIGQQGDGPL